MITCEALAVTCMDFRFQRLLDTWLQEYIGHGNYDRVAFAGAAKNSEVILSQVALAKELHDIQRVVLINHEDCGAYGEAGTLEKHTHDLRTMARMIHDRYPDVQVDLYFASLPDQPAESANDFMTHIEIVTVG